MVITLTIIRSSKCQEDQYKGKFLDKKGVCWYLKLIFNVVA